MQPVWHNLIERLHASGRPTVLVTTGGGSGALADLLAVPGASATILEGIVPYSPMALTDWLGKAPEKFCSDETALNMAAAAYDRARHLSSAPSATALPQGRLTGLGCTAALVSNRPKLGDHRCFIAVQTASTTTLSRLVLEKGARDRAGEEAIVSQLILLHLATAAGLDSLPEPALRPGEHVDSTQTIAPPLIADVLHARKGLAWSYPDSRCTEDRPLGLRGVLCGAFNPLHDGHRQLRSVAADRLGGLVGYEISLHNVDKPPLDYLTVDRRRAQFTAEPLALTNAPTFAAKCAVLPGVTFVVGADTAERIVQPRYYAGREDLMFEALRQIRDHGCRFLVAGRLTGDRFVSLHDLKIPAEFADLFEEIPASEFRSDLSSTAERKKQPE